MVCRPPHLCARAAACRRASCRPRGDWWLSAAVRAVPGPGGSVFTTALAIRPSVNATTGFHVVSMAKRLGVWAPLPSRTIRGYTQPEVVGCVALPGGTAVFSTDAATGGIKRLA